MALPREKQYTVEEFEDYIGRPENADRLFELINGEMVEKVPTQEHGIIAVNISTELRNEVKRSGSGRVAVEVRHQAPGDKKNVRLPDIAYYADTAQPIVKRGPVPRMPDLAVEILSPDDSLKGAREKAQYYMAHGTRLVWIVAPAKRLIVVLSPDDEQILLESETLDGGDVLPGFTLPVRDVFAD